MTDTADELSSRGLTLYGEYSVRAGGSMNLPVEARRAMGIEGRAASVLIFGRPGQTVLTPAPPAEELLEFASARAIERVFDRAPDDESRDRTRR